MRERDTAPEERVGKVLDGRQFDRLCNGRAMREFVFGFARRVATALHEAGIILDFRVRCRVGDSVESEGKKAQCLEGDEEHYV